MKANIKHTEMITWQLHEYDVQVHRQGQDEIWIYCMINEHDSISKIQQQTKWYFL